MKVIFPVAVYQKLRAYVDNTRYEISGLGKVSRSNDSLIIEDVRIFKQHVNAAETVLSHRELAAFYDEIITEEGDLSNWKLWWHSHATFDTFFSATDVTTIKDFDSEMYQDNWMLSIVTNHNRDLQARLDVFYPFHITLDNLDWDILYEDRAVKLNVLDEIAEKVIPSVNYSGKRDDAEIDFKNKRKAFVNKRILFNPDGSLKTKEQLDMDVMSSLLPSFESDIEEGVVL